MTKVASKPATAPQMALYEMEYVYRDRRKSNILIRIAIKGAMDKKPILAPAYSPRNPLVLIISFV